jgi:hypothetical protein
LLPGVFPEDTLAVVGFQGTKKRDLLRKQQIPLFPGISKTDKLLTCGSLCCATTTNCRIENYKNPFLIICAIKIYFIVIRAKKQAIIT